MKWLFFLILPLILLLVNCNQNEGSLPNYTFKAQLINATTNEVPVGLKITLEASTFPDGISAFKTEILGTAFTDSFGRFSITYKKSKLPILTLLSQFITYNDLPINKNVDTVFYRSNKGTLVFILTADKPLTIVDTLFIGTPADEGGGGVIRTIIGPLLPNHIITYRCVPSNGTASFWNIGWGLYNYKSYNSHKYKNQIISYNMRGDPFIDTIKIKYR